MQTPNPILVGALITALGCSDPQCRPNEILIGMTCYSKKLNAADAASPEASMFDVDARVVRDAIDAELEATTTLQPTGSDAAQHQCGSQSERCDGEDNDCDGRTDEGVLNVCGGCSLLEHAVGESCSNGGTGNCATMGQYVCEGGSVACNAPAALPEAEQCDGVDNDCDGHVDESGRTWYRDCDGDGYAVLADSLEGCMKPSVPGCLELKSIRPGSGTTDCNDTSPEYRPGADYGFTGDGDGDLNCDGLIEKKYPFSAAMPVLDSLDGTVRYDLIKSSGGTSCPTYLPFGPAPQGGGDVVVFASDLPCSVGPGGGQKLLRMIVGSSGACQLDKSFGDFTSPTDGGLNGVFMIQPTPKWMGYQRCR